MSQTVIKVENLSKQYRLGNIGTGTLRSDFQRFWANLVGKEDPTLKIGAENSLADNLASSGDYVWALRDINFEVKQGEVLGIIGKNGAGKSTLLKILSQVTAPSKGEVKVKGRIASLLEVGTGFHPELTGRENIFLNGAILGMSKAEIRSKFDEIVEFAGVAKYIDTPVKRYSSGMYVRLAFAVAAHLEPEILIVDEVLAVGDAEFQKRALGKMQDISSGQGRTVLFVSHNMASIQALCSKCIALANGTISYSKSETLEVLDFYLNSREEESKIDLDHRADRIGEGNIKATFIQIFDEQDNLLKEVRSGQRVKLCIGYKLIKKETYKDVSVAISITRSDGFLVTVLSNYISDKSFSSITDDGKMICYLDKMPLMAGRYFLNLTINRDAIVEDWVREALFFTVVDGDFYGTGRLPQKTHNSVLIEQNWGLTNIQ